MTNLEAQALVVAMACLTESRTNDEQRALLTIARQVDAERNKLADRNVGEGKMWAKVEGGYRRQGEESRLEERATETRVVDPEDGDREVRLPAPGKRLVAYRGQTFVPLADA